AELPQLVRANLVTEAARRNTAAAVGYAAVEVRRRRGPGAVLAVLPTDHHVAGAEAFDAAARRAAALAAEGYIVTIGVAPTRPETGFGWLEIGAPIASGPVSGSASGPAYGPASGPASGSRPGGARDAAGGPAGTAEPPAAFELARFVEKPARARAEEFLADPAGRFLWNGGMFFFRADRILAEIARQMPALASALDAIAADPSAAAARYLGLPADLPSIDYGVMEHAARLACVAAPPALGWSDVGSWAALRELLPPDAHGNVVHAPAQARVVAVDARNNLVHAPVRLVALLGVEGLSVVYEDGVLLVCPLDQSQRVRELVARVRADEELKEVL
ncbi:MAG TPA: sugar phosphate nucleotidyltransferase, partial [Myxococcota bacterium]|nr:sugar phosphate nucleotidyltransferase [Myxococcota bacterium]